MFLFEFLAITNPAINPKVGTGKGNEIIGDLISRMIRFAMILGTLTCFLYLVLAGYEWMTAGGDKAKVESARNRITQALVGLAIIASAYAIIIVIEKFLGITVFSGPIELPVPGSSTAPPTAVPTRLAVPTRPGDFRPI